MSEKKLGKRLLTWVLVLVMTLSTLPLNVLADEVDRNTAQDVVDEFTLVGNNSQNEYEIIPYADTKTVAIDKGTANHCNVFYVESTDQTKLNDFKSSINHDLTPAYSIVFFVAPEDGYALTKITAAHNSTKAAEFFSIADNTDVTKTEFYTKTSSTGTKATPYNKLLAAGFNEEALDARVKEAVENGCVAALIYSRESNDWTSITASLSFYTQQLATLTKEIVSVNNKPYSEDLDVNIDDTITYRLTVNYYRGSTGNNVLYSNVRVVDKLVNYDSDTDSSHPFNGSGASESTTVDYQVKAEDIKNNQIVNEATLSYSYTATFNTSTRSATDKATAPITFKNLVSYEYTGTVPDGANELLLTPKNEKAGDSVKVADAPSLNGYTFSGWKATKQDGSIDPDVIVDSDGNFIMPNHSVTFTGSWTANTVTLTFDANGGAWESAVDGYTMGTDNKTASVTGELGALKLQQISTDPVNAGYDFTGWYEEQECKNLVSLFYSIPLRADTTLYAGWAPRQVDEFSCTIRQHFVDLTGESIIPPFTATAVAASTPIADLIANYTSNQTWNGLTYCYDASQTTVNDSPIAANQTLTGDTVIDLYYYLDTWNDENNSTTEGDGIPDMYQAVVKFESGNPLFGKVEGSNCTQVFTLTDSNGNPTVSGSVTPSLDGVEATPLNAAVRRFSMWTDDSGNECDDPTEMITVNGGSTTVFKAQFEKIPTTYTVTYDLAGGSTTSANITFSELIYGTETPTIIDPTRDGYTFAGWSPEVSEKVTGNATYVAQWTAIEYGYTIHHYLLGTETKVANDTEGKLNIGDTLNAVSVKTFYAGFEKAVPVTPLAESKTITANPSENVLTVYYTVPLIITAGSDSKVYDGNPLTCNKFKVEGLVNGDKPEDIKLAMTANSTITTSGTQSNVIDTDKVEGVKDYYTVEYNPGELEITPVTEKVTVTIKGNTKSVTYNGSEQSVSGYEITFDNQLYKKEYVKLTGDAVAKGTNRGTYYMGLAAEKFENINDNFTNVAFEVTDGKLEITRRPVTPPSRPTTPTIEIDDDDALGLNTTDHFAYIVGYGNGEVRPQNNITRAEVATIFFRLLTDDVRDANLSKTNRYSDVADTAWYNTAVSTLSAMGIITGYPDGTFRPNAAITRAEFAAIAARFDTNGDKTTAAFTDIASHWAKDEISIAANNGWIKGYEDNTFRPQRDITRAETMTLVNRVLNRQPETEDDLLPNMTVWTDNADKNAWYYLAVQEATNSHYYEFKTNSVYEKWTELRETRDWTQLEK